MKRDFRYLRDKYTDAGARSVFEDICTQLFQAKFESTYPVRVTQGDGGIDIFVGDFDKEIDVYQCKYFIDGIGEAQQAQIRSSYLTAKNSTKYKIKNWYLCVPSTLSIKEFTWWSGWKSRSHTQDNIPIGLYDGSYLLGQLKKYEIYKYAFDDDVRQNLEVILSYLCSEKERIFNEIIVTLNTDESDTFNNLIFVKKLESANIENIDICKNDFFNAEIAEQSIQSKGDERVINVYKQLKIKVHSFWNTQYMRYKSDNDGNELLSRTYERIEDADNAALKSIDEINLLAKKGMLHQLAEDCSVGWLLDYQEKLESYLVKGCEKSAYSE